MMIRRLRQLPPEARPHIAAAGRVLAQATARMNTMSPREIAEAAYTPGGPSREQLEKLAEARLMGQSIRHTPPAEVA
ncbi:hypothetical protein [Paenarthrobacter sp. YJN-5]|uniref:hypothetical protein n=1 Tax=Paenarthrobacter sp. YJN-5 TaxID=2735316 RepID=UPI001878D948|nr:hypothetical protein [Paenarthrobacter sp. YJN-5]QOT16508.1 hypothetical protein HMI59_07745 [Paenarthrobacter sp. YJN-5]